MSKVHGGESTGGRGYTDYYIVEVWTTDHDAVPWQFILHGDMAPEQAIAWVVLERVPQIPALRGRTYRVEIKHPPMQSDGVLEVPDGWPQPQDNDEWRHKERRDGD